MEIKKYLWKYPTFFGKHYNYNSGVTTVNGFATTRKLQSIIQWDCFDCIVNS